jgi:hypothetical protein
VQTFDAQATLVDPSGLRDGLTTTIARADIEDALRLEEPPALVLDVLQPGDVTSSLAVAWKRDELERLLQKATGEHVALTFDRAAIEQALDADVEAHGFREKAAMFTIAVAATAGFAGAASGTTMPQGGGGPISPVSIQSDPSDGGIVDPATGVKMATLTDGGLVDPVTGVKVVSSASDSTTVSDLAPAAAAVGGAIALVILGASFGLGGDRRRPALT